MGRARARWRRARVVAFYNLLRAITDPLIHCFCHQSALNVIVGSDYPTITSETPFVADARMMHYYS